MTGQVYKNGVAFGTSQTTTSTSPVTKTEALTFAAGDYIDVYFKISGADTANMENIKLSSAVKLFG